MDFMRLQWQIFGYSDTFDAKIEGEIENFWDISSFERVYLYKNDFDRLTLQSYEDPTWT